MSTDPLALMAQCFDGLLQMRSLRQSHPNDSVVQLVNYCAAHTGQSKSQLFQDLMVGFFTQQKRGGVFVEFGATNDWRIPKVSLDRVRSP